MMKMFPTVAAVVLSSLLAKAGYYRVPMQLNMTETAVAGFTLYLFLSKNGSTIKQSIQLINYTAGFNQSMNLDTIVYLNGTIDYLDGSFETNSGTATILGGSSTTFFSANYVHD